ncbi:hypothetical protein N9R48_00190 [Rickettsiales bacterium]|jgi:hypothetical protein|nr:hypothetical protein [Rickettsiales bacterium]
MKSLEEQLTEVQQAISDVLNNAQEASYNGQRVKKADLAILEQREKRLLVQIKRKKRGGIRIRGITPT